MPRNDFSPPAPLDEAAVDTVLTRAGASFLAEIGLLDIPEEHGRCPGMPASDYLTARTSRPGATRDPRRCRHRRALPGTHHAQAGRVLRGNDVGGDMLLIDEQVRVGAERPTFVPPKMRNILTVVMPTHAFGLAVRPRDRKPCAGFGHQQGSAVPSHSLAGTCGPGNAYPINGTMWGASRSVRRGRGSRAARAGTRWPSSR